MDAGFRIGIELEILLTHRKKAKDEFPDLEAFANHLIAHFHAARRPYPRVHNDVDGIYEGSEISAEWSLTDDVTIKPDTDDQCMSQCHPYPNQSTNTDQGRWSSCLPSFNTMREVYGVMKFATCSELSLWFATLKPISHAAFMCTYPLPKTALGASTR